MPNAEIRNRSCRAHPICDAGTHGGIDEPRAIHFGGMMDWIIAHQGSWDEALMFVIPIAIAIGVIKYTEKRGARKRAERFEADSEPEPKG